MNMESFENWIEGTHQEDLVTRTAPSSELLQRLHAIPDQIATTVVKPSFMWVSAACIAALIAFNVISLDKQNYQQENTATNLYDNYFSYIQHL